MLIRSYNKVNIVNFGKITNIETRKISDGRTYVFRVFAETDFVNYVETDYKEGKAIPGIETINAGGSYPRFYQKTNPYTSAVINNKEILLGEYSCHGNLKYVMEKFWKALENGKEFFFFPDESSKEDCDEFNLRF